MKINELTQKEEKVLSDALEIFEKQFDEEEGATADVFNYDNESVDVIVTFIEGEGHQITINRANLLTMKPMEIANSIG